MGGGGGGGSGGWDGFHLACFYESGRSSPGQRRTACEGRREVTCLLDA